MVVTDAGKATIEHLESNVSLNLENIEKAGGSCAVLEYLWGTEPPAALLRNFDLVLASDLLFITLRDGLEAELREAMTFLCRGPGTRFFFSYKERLPMRERAFMAELGRTLDCISIPLDGGRLKRDLGPDDDGGLMASMFYTPDTVQLYELKCKEGVADGKGGRGGSK